MFVIVAVPCLNEEESVEGVCRSLGFGAGADLPDVESVLVLVDNGSRDGTVSSMERIAIGSPKGSVLVVREPCRGFVPARHRGALEARRVAAQRGMSEDQTLLVQADADTFYMPNFLATMAQCSSSAGLGALVEGYSEAQPISEEFAAYRRLETMVDAAAAGVMLDAEFDVVVDDKVAAMRLSDYFAWGGHRREWANDGDEVLAETTRLYMRARLRGGHRCRAEAFAWTSLRRVIQDPGLAFATAGHPRGPRWRAKWSRSYIGPSTLPKFNAALSPEATIQLVHARVMHLVGLFRLLPAWTAASTGLHGLDSLADLDGSPSAEVGAARPGAVVDWAMSRTWEEIIVQLAANAVDVQHVVATAQRINS